MLPLPTKTRVPTGPPRNLLWTVDQFHYIGDLGMFEGRRAMLIDGIVVEEGPMNPPHAIAATKTQDAVRDVFGKGFHVRVAKPLVLSQTTDPEPDVAAVLGKPGDYTDPGWFKHPEGTVAFEWTGSLAEPARFKAEGGQSMPLKSGVQKEVEVQVRKPSGHSGH